MAAILKDEDPFVEEWVAYHRLLGIDHFYLYDNDPRQPLSNILTLHLDYVTVRPWLVDHDDKRYPGRTKQLKAYVHCLEHDAARHAWITFLDCDEFIVLEQHTDLKVFLANFEGYDSIALNWHVFGHNGHYDDPPGLIIESLTRRMREPRPFTKSVSRCDAIDSIKSAHLCRLKKGRRLVDANRRKYRKELYAGKTLVAHINHYQCRSFTRWMRRFDRGEVGAFAEDPANAWRFSQEGCLRQFVSQIAVDKNEHIDTSMLRYVEPIKSYLSELRKAKETGESVETRITALATSSVPEAVTGKQASDGRGPRSSARAIVASAPPFISRPLRFLATLVRSGQVFALSLFGDQSAVSQAMARASRASKTGQWPRAVMLWQAILDEAKGRAPPAVYRNLGHAHRRLGHLNHGAEFLHQGLARYPKNVGILAELAEYARARKDWGHAAQCGRAVLNIVKSEPDLVADGPIATACFALMEDHAYARVIATLQDLKRTRGQRRLLLAIEGLAYLRSSQMEVARQHWDAYWRRAIDDADLAQQRPAKILSIDLASHNSFRALQPTDRKVLGRGDGRFCVYTALFGEYDELRSPAYRPPGVEFICFSDRPRDALGWDVRIVDLELDTAALKNRRVKIMPYEYLEEFDYSLYIDSNIVFLGNPLDLYQRWLKDVPFVAWRHPERACVYGELEQILVSCCHEPDAIIDQYIFFAERGLPRDTPILEACFLWRDHRDFRIRDLMEQWWHHLNRFRCHRDQPALGYLMWKTRVQPEVFPNHVGTSRVNEFTRKLPHNQSVLSLERAKVSDHGSSEGDGSDRFNGRRKNQRATRTGERKRLIWVYREKFGTVASTVMRAYQIAEIARLHLDGTAEVGQVNELHAADQRDSVLILSKSFLKEASTQNLAQLKEHGNTICADYVDDPASHELHDCIDVYIASSIKQFVHYSKKYGDKLVHLITHHPDPRLDGTRGPKDHCAIGYFGETANTRFVRELEGTVDFCLVNTQVVDSAWISRLPQYNVHYAIRKRRTFSGFKPFVKGFTAAQCHSNIIVSKNESDALYYLGSDYPYMLDDVSLDSVMDMIDRVKTSFGGPEWQRGLEIMTCVRQRCDPRHIGQEVGALLSLCR